MKGREKSPSKSRFSCKYLIAQVLSLSIPPFEKIFLVIGLFITDILSVLFMKKWSGNQNLEEYEFFVFVTKRQLRKEKMNEHEKVWRKVGTCEFSGSPSTSRLGYEASLLETRWASPPGPPAVREKLVRERSLKFPVGKSFFMQSAVQSGLIFNLVHASRVNYLTECTTAKNPSWS